MKLRLHCALAGLASVLSIHFVAILEPRGIYPLYCVIPGITFESIIWIAAGTLCGGLLFSRTKHTGGFALAISGATIIAITLSQNLWESAWAAAFFFSAMLLPAFFQSVLQQSACPGLHFGLALGAADCFWNFLLVLPFPASGSIISSCLLLLQALAGMLLLPCLEKNYLPTNVEKTDNVAIYNKISPLFYLTAILFVSFSVLAYTPALPNPETAYISKTLALYTWFAFPLAGLYLDNHSFNISFAFVCIGGTLLAGIGVSVIGGTIIQLPAGALALFCRNAALLCLLLFIAHGRTQSPMVGLTTSLPYLIFLGAFCVVAKSENFQPHVSTILSLLLFFTLATGYCCLRLKLSIAIEPVKVDNNLRREVHPLYQPDAFDSFAQKYTISLREQDVLRLIMEGQDTTGIGLSLHLSEHTIKSHVRQILRKTKTRNRITLAALFFNETGNRSETKRAQNYLRPPFGL